VFVVFVGKYRTVNFVENQNDMKCDTCKFKSFHFGAGAPDDYSMDYCAKGHWEGGELGDDDEENSHWDDCKDYQEENA
jgi:hypothetical protein